MKFAFAIAGALLMVQSVSAQESVPEDFTARLSGFLGPNFPISSVAESPIPGVYEVEAGGQYLYVAIKDQMILIGEMYDAERRVSLGEQKRQEQIQAVAEKEIPSMPVDELIVFKGDESKRHITVFTDVECGYCRKLHQEVPKLNEAGIEVRYAWFPRLRETSRPKAISVACADDPLEAMTRAKAGKNVKSKECDNPVDEQFEIGMKIGVQGTPFIVLDDMSVIGGYLPAEKLISRMGL